MTISENIIGEAAALFGAIDGASIADLGIVNANISGATYVGVLVGYAKSGSI